jgi:hypothetical protein
MMQQLELRHAAHCCADQLPSSAACGRSTRTPANRRRPGVQQCVTGGGCGAAGAHTLGRVKPSRSGYGKEKTKYTEKGPGTPGGSSWTVEWLKFDNSYFKARPLCPRAAFPGVGFGAAREEAGRWALRVQGARAGVVGMRVA